MTSQTLPRRRTSDPSGGHQRAEVITFPAPEVAAGATGIVLIEPQILERAARVIRVLGHPLRLRLLEVLEGGEHHVTDLVNASGASQALVSQHLAILRAEGVVGARRDGLHVFYRITEPKVHRILACIRDCDLPNLTGEATAALFDLAGDA